MIRREVRSHRQSEKVNVLCRPFSQKLRPHHIFHAVDGSLKRLRTDYIDLYQLHNPTIAELQREDIQEAMDRLQDAGKIFWGISVSTVEEGVEIINRNWGYAL